MTAADSESPASRPPDTTTTPLQKICTKSFTHLKLKNFALVGFSMGGGEVARYIGKYGSKDVSKAVILAEYHRTC